MRLLTVCSAFCLALCVMVLLSACNASIELIDQDTAFGNPAGIVDTTGGQEAEKINLRFAWWGFESRHKATLEAIKVFEGKFPGIKVNAEFQEYDGYHEKMITQLAVGSAPDLFQFNPEDLPVIASRGQVYSLSSHIGKEIDLSQVDDSVLYDGKYDGKLYGIPLSIQASALFYNKRLYDSADVAYPHNDWTWEDYKRICGELGKRLPGGVYPTYDMRFTGEVLMIMIHQEGGSYLADDGTVNFGKYIAKPVEFFQQLVDLGLAPPIEMTAVDSSDRQALFNQGKVAMYISYNCMASSIQGNMKNGDKIGMVMVPGTYNTGHSGVWPRSELAVLINNSTEYPGEAMTFLNSLINDTDMGSTLGLVRGLPPSKKIQGMVLSNLSELDKQLVDIQNLVGAHSDKPELRHTKGWSRINDICDEELKQYAFKRISLEKAIEDMVSRYEKTLKDAQ